MHEKSTRSWVRWFFLVLVGGAIIGIGITTIMFSRWGDIRSVDRWEAESALATARAVAGEQPAYIEIAPGGSVSLHRELEREVPGAIHTLRLVAWDPVAGRLITADLPYWFVRVKMTEHLNLGTLTTALSGDWANLDLRVAQRDLERRGPGLLMDHTALDGTQLLMWSE